MSLALSVIIASQEGFQPACHMNDFFQRDGLHLYCQMSYKPSRFRGIAATLVDRKELTLT